ncbi:hypothetical protein ABK040_005292 [Willaertia magna]
MTSLKLSELKLFDEKTLTFLSQHSIHSTYQLLLQPKWHLRYLLNTKTNEEAENIILEIIKKINLIQLKPKTVLNLFYELQNEYISIKSLQKLNNLFSGGISTISITEIVGKNNCGKTEFCLTTICDLLLLHFDSFCKHLQQYENFENLNLDLLDLEGFGCIFFDTEKKSSQILRRLYQLLTVRFQEYFSNNNKLNENDILKKLEILIQNYFHIFEINSSNELLTHLDNLEEFIFEKKIKLIVIDSLGALVYREFNGREGGLFERASILQTKATLLKELSAKFKVGVLVTNILTEQTEQVHLGVNWYHFVNHRLQITRLSSQQLLNLLQQSNNQQQQTIFALAIQKSAQVPFVSIPIYIDDGGVKELEKL